jgi:hypothetical protein
MDCTGWSSHSDIQYNSASGKPSTHGPWIYWAIAPFLSLFINAPAEPGPGDVFIEYGMKIDKTITNSGMGEIDTIPGSINLADAIKAEMAVEFANVHLGIKGQAVRINGSDWIPIPFPASIPAVGGEQDHIYMKAVVTVDVPLSCFKDGSNTFQFKVDPGEQPMSYTQFYGATFRFYYDPSKKVHSSGKITSPASGSSIGGSVDLTVKIKGDASKVQYVGNYEDVDYNGDGMYGGWVYSYRYGEFADHIGTASTAPFSCTWNTSWVPDQPHPMQIAARIIDDVGVIYMTDAVKDITISRGDFSVELCKPYGLLNGFSTCTYGTPQGPVYTADIRNKTEYFEVRGEIEKATDARLVFNGWKRHSAPAMSINDVLLTGITVDGGGNQFVNVPLRPVSALKSGHNTLILVNAKDGGTDIHWPGVQVLIRYKAE